MDIFGVPLLSPLEDFIDQKIEEFSFLGLVRLELCKPSAHRCVLQIKHFKSLEGVVVKATFMNSLASYPVMHCYSFVSTLTC